jgi:hypothetical protein
MTEADPLKRNDEQESVDEAYMCPNKHDLTSEICVALDKKIDVYFFDRGPLRRKTTWPRTIHVNCFLCAPAQRYEFSVAARPSTCPEVTQ